MTALDWDATWLPRFPLVSDDLATGLYRQRRPLAMDRRYVEANPNALSNLLIVDIDHPAAHLKAIENHHGWMPNLVIENPQNFHAHAIWALNIPIARTEYARRKPLAYAAAITEGLRRASDGDVGYSGLITKNPLHQDWWAHSYTDHLYSLEELHEHLDAAGFMPGGSWRRSERRNTVGLGRNCSIFETARIWAYRELRHYFGNPRSFSEAVHQHVMELNAEFPEPLSYAEAKAIAKSISTWIITRSRLWHDGPVVYEATFSTIQAARGRKGGPAEARAKAAKNAQIILEELS